MALRAGVFCRNLTNLAPIRNNITKQNVNHSDYFLAHYPCGNMMRPSGILARGLRQINKTSTRSVKGIRPAELESVSTGHTGSTGSAFYRPGLAALVKPAWFTLMVSGVSFGTCAIWQYESLRTVIKDSMKGVKGFTEGKAGGLRMTVNQWWNSLTPGQRVTTSIIACNVAVFLMWRVPVLQPTMMKYFASNPTAGSPCWSMLFSMFSQVSAWHLAANMYVLWSFSNVITSVFGREQYLAMYMSAGMVSGLTSYMYKIARGSTIPSLGASGAIMAVLGAVCCYYPDAQLSIVGVSLIYPHSFSADTAQKCIIAFDAAGVILGLKFFDHAAHLGGMLFGMWYVNYGHTLIWANREPFLKWWHKMRGQP